MLTFEESFACYKNDFPNGFSDFSRRCEARWRQLLGKWCDVDEGSGSSAYSASLLQQESEAARCLSGAGEAGVLAFLNEVMYEWLLPHRELIQA